MPRGLRIGVATTARFPVPDANDAPGAPRPQYRYSRSLPRVIAKHRPAGLTVPPGSQLMQAVRLARAVSASPHGDDLAMRRSLPPASPCTAAGVISAYRRPDMGRGLTRQRKRACRPRRAYQRLARGRRCRLVSSSTHGVESRAHLKPISGARWGRRRRPGSRQLRDPRIPRATS